MKVALPLFVALALFGLGGLSATASANEPTVFYDGQKLYDQCTKGDAGDGMLAAICAGYVVGVVDSIEFREAMAGRHSCLASGVGARTLVDLTVQWLKEHPAERDLGAASAVLFAISDGYHLCTEALKDVRGHPTPHSTVP